VIKGNHHSVRLAYRPPYDWEAMLGFLAARATPGVERVEGSRYTRTISLDGVHGEISVAPARSALVLHVSFPDATARPRIVARVRRMFDLDADPHLIAGHLGRDRLLRRALAAHPGIRLPSAWDGFELTVRAILGQQISVRAATTIAGRIAAAFGSRVNGDTGVSLFPSPAQLAEAPLERHGVVAARAACIRALAREVAAGRIAFDRFAGGRDACARLRTVPGIGPWTAEYVAMRACGEPDAFPSGDLVLRRLAGVETARELEQRAARWRPWRAYAVMHLWQSLSKE